jgi:SAM-dependent methyltransferase
MPASSPLGKLTTKSWFESRNDIKTIVDVGCGEGTYRKLLGQNYHWIGVDVWEPYVERFHLRDIYDEIIIGNIKDLSLTTGDCYIFGDVLEHLPKDDAINVINKIPKDKHIIISIPLGIYEQGELEGNPHEAHKGYWTYDEVYNLADWTETHTWCFNPDLPKLITLGLLTLGLFIK